MDKSAIHEIKLDILSPIGNTTVPSQWKGSFSFTSCPSAQRVGPLLAYVLSQSSTRVCFFEFRYSPSKPFIMPQLVPKSGSSIVLNIEGYNDFFGALSCCVLVGNLIGASIILNQSTFTMVAHPTEIRGIFPIILSCQGLTKTLDLRTFVENVGTSKVSVVFSDSLGCLLQSCFLWEFFSLAFTPEST